jgi:murein DD-endopeptidase MepM/ murein hydrolase activator NlpD
MTGHPAFSRLALLAAALVAVSSCTRTSAPAPVSVYNEQPAPSAPGMVTVGRGDTVYELAQRYNVPMREVIELNRLTPPYALTVGQRLRLPTARFYTVQRGDTMYGISRMHQVGMSELARANGLQEPYAIRVGQQLQLPGGGAPAVQVAENSRAALPSSPAPAPRPAVVAEAVPEAPQQNPSLPPYQPRRGFGMAQSGSVAAPAPITAPAPIPEPVPAPVEVARAPTVQPPPSPQLQPQPSTQPVVPPPAHTQVAALPPRPAPAPTAHPVPKVPPRPPQTAPAPQAASVPAPTPPPAPAPAATAASVPAPPPAPPPAPAEVAAAKPPAMEAPEPRGGSRFLWPLRGAILSDFGPKPGGLHNDGINISASRGASVVAADNGVVAYAGNELRGFGNLLLIRHADGWMTAYAHLDDMLVERGAKVTRGQKIGTVGSTGNVSSPQLHFEVRRGNRAIDPRDHLGSEKRVSRDASPDGRPGPG